MTNYYLLRASALRDISELMAQGLSTNKIYFKIGAKHGFAPKSIDEMIKVVEGGIGDG